ncbi:GNAT family N-acetyltransferase [Oricola sp.]|uniref:GNAT family N-acetyltransferase n=1 Tax=Oricola sp. TaxID=1979950 RepID=UPI0025F56640|nr:GNAT family N-acetyltransferase [Oricola sp.]MCI5073937.1 GNAT family N-acetyltransferase [Oricola sp.]
MNDNPVIREAVEADLPALAAIYSGDDKGGHGDTTDPAALPHYRAAFRRIEANPGIRLLVVEKEGEVVGTAQVVLVPALTGRGASRMIVEAVHVRADMRGMRLGEALMRHCVELGREAGVRLVELTSNARRTDAHRFYERLGFKQSHLGFKMTLY